MVAQDENRYNAGRGAHLTLKRAEKARALVNKLPGESFFLTELSFFLFSLYLFRSYVSPLCPIVFWIFLVQSSKFFGLHTAMVDQLASKTVSWEKEKGIEFTYDGVSTCLKILKLSRFFLLVSHLEIGSD